MKYNPDNHHRRSIRLKDYEYSQAESYYVTVCIQERLCLFGDVLNSMVVLTDAGKMIEKTFLEIPEKYPGSGIDVFIVMPNHMHGIIVVGVTPCGRPSNGDPVSGSDGQSGQPQGVAPADGKKLCNYPLDSYLIREY